MMRRNHLLAAAAIGVMAVSALSLSPAQAGLTTLTSGGWDVRRNGLDVTNAGSLAVAGTTLPTAGLGASWSLLNLITLSVGYETFMLPTSLRTQGTRLPDAKTTINSLNLGARILVFSF